MPRKVGNELRKWTKVKYGDIPIAKMSITNGTVTATQMTVSLPSSPPSSPPPPPTPPPTPPPPPPTIPPLSLDLPEGVGEGEKAITVVVVVAAALPLLGTPPGIEIGIVFGNGSVEVGSVLDTRGVEVSGEVGVAVMSTVLRLRLIIGAPLVAESI